MLHEVLGVSWEERMSNLDLYMQDSLSLSEKICARKLKFAGHCYHHPELPVSKLVRWEPKRGQAKIGRPNVDRDSD